MIINLAPSLQTSVLDAVLTALNAGTGNATIEFYTGAMPATPATAITTQTLLGTLTCSDPVGTVSGNELTFGAITQDSAADATGTAAWARIKDATGTSVIDLDVTNTGGNGAIKLNSVNIVAGGPISISAGVIRV